MDRYNQIILESARLFREKGYPSTSIRDIGTALGITSAALYHHFKCKDALLLAIVQSAIQQVQHEVEAAVDTEKSSVNRLYNAIKAHMNYSMRNRDFVLVHLKEIRHLNPESKAIARSGDDKYESMWFDLFVQAQAEQVIASHVDIHLAMMFLYGAMNLSVQLYGKKDDNMSADELAEALFHYVTQGVAGDGFVSPLSE